VSDEIFELGRAGEQDLAERRRRLALGRRGIRRHGRAHALEEFLHGVSDAVGGAEREPAAKRLGHHIGQPIAGDNAGDVGVKRIGDVAGKRCRAERRAADPGNGDGADGRTLLVREAERALVMPDLAIGVAWRHDHDAALAIDERRELRLLLERQARGVVEEVVDDGVALPVAEERQTRGKLCLSRHLILPAE
jgi:hypothetical protein